MFFRCVQIRLMKTILLSIFLTISHFSFAQQSFVGAGGDASSEEGYISYSVGQIFYTSVNTNRGSNSQGVQQAYEIVELTKTPDSKKLKMVVYPNPTSNFIILEMKGEEIPKLTYVLYELNGKILKNGAVNARTTELSMNDMESAVYLLKIYRGKKLIKSFRIIKNN